MTGRLFDPQPKTSYKTANGLSRGVLEPFRSVLTGRKGTFRPYILPEPSRTPSTMSCAAADPDLLR